MAAQPDTQPLYRQLKERIAARIETGDWPPGHRVPSENELVAETGASRMTVNRALRELADEGAIRRVRGAGSFVAERKPASDLMELPNIADEIAARGHRHAARVLNLARAAAARDEAARLGLRPKVSIYRSLIVHYEGDRPVQIEDRLVNPTLAPDYLAVDFTRETPNAYLTRVAPATAVENRIEAIAADPTIARRLGITTGAPCLAVDRRTWVGETVASVVRLTYPGARYRLSAGAPRSDAVAPL